MAPNIQSIWYFHFRLRPEFKDIFRFKEGLNLVESRKLTLNHLNKVNFLNLSLFF